jgi:tetratricopeptide (TPR) repeat protein
MRVLLRSMSDYGLALNSDDPASLHQVHRTRLFVESDRERRQMMVRRQSSRQLQAAKPVTAKPVTAKLVTAKPDAAIVERMLAEVHALLDAQQFRTLAEGQAFLRGLFAARDVPWITGAHALSDLPGFYEPSVSARGSLEDLAEPFVDAADLSVSDPLARAQDLIYDAFEAPTKRERVRLARQALKISPDCADAYGILAGETARTPLAARKLLEQGVAAGERALGPEAFEEDVGHFWGILETRPYMRVRESLAGVLWELGERKAAIGHAQDMLRLNPNDNQGIRYALLEWLLAEPDSGPEVAKLLAEFKEDSSAPWVYGRALHLFRSAGATRTAAAALRKAVKLNPHVPAYLLGDRKLPKELPGYVGWGDEDEAVVYVDASMPQWRGVPGAVEWLRKAVAR